jgi:hypothetical protein
MLEKSNKEWYADCLFEACSIIKGADNIKLSCWKPEVLAQAVITVADQLYEALEKKND